MELEDLEVMTSKRSHAKIDVRDGGSSQAKKGKTAEVYLIEFS